MQDWRQKSAVPDNNRIWQRIRGYGKNLTVGAAVDEGSLFSIMLRVFTKYIENANDDTIFFRTKELRDALFSQEKQTN